LGVYWDEVVVVAVVEFDDDTEEAANPIVGRHPLGYSSIGPSLLLHLLFLSDIILKLTQLDEGKNEDGDEDPLAYILGLLANAFRPSFRAHGRNHRPGAKIRVFSHLVGIEVTVFIC
jgi:hypothetical protein